eukprot:Nk52_evm32s153 gene=Nk52_evmTU32s153
MSIGCEVRDSPVHGKGLFASKNLPAGSVVLEELPLVSDLAAVPSEEKVCHKCFKPSVECDTIKACSMCKHVQYCSRGCQRADWKLHKPICKKFAKLILYPGGSETVLTILAGHCFLARLLVDYDTYFDMLDSVVHKGDELFKYTRPDLYLKAEQSIAMIVNAFQIPSPTAKRVDEIISLFSRFRVNAFRIPIRGKGGMLQSESFEASGLYPMTTRANHSCMPTATYIISNNVLRMRLARGVRKDEEVFTCYNGNNIACQSYAMRQEYMLQNFGFKCKCVECTQSVVNDPEWLRSIECDNEYLDFRAKVCSKVLGFTEKKSMDEIRSAVLCQKDRCNGVVYGYKIANQTCSKCDLELDREQKKKVDALLSKYNRDWFVTIKNRGECDPSEAKGCVSDLLKFLSLASTLLHPLHYAINICLTGLGILYGVKLDFVQSYVVMREVVFRAVFFSIGHTPYIAKSGLELLNSMAYAPQYDMDKTFAKSLRSKKHIPLHYKGVDREMVGHLIRYVELCATMCMDNDDPDAQNINELTSKIPLLMDFPQTPMMKMLEENPQHMMKEMKEMVNNLFNGGVQP